jgi:Stress responsive A/B Barrel Domain
VIRHIVMWNVRADSPEQKARHIETLIHSFQSLNGLIPGLLHLHVGVDQSRVDYACDVVLYSEFESTQALAAYALHPEHLRVKAEIGDMRIARHQVDYEIT